jgi:predicted AlkP superfamily pyrophosphatase or phosphodiesterase
MSDAFGARRRWLLAISYLLLSALGSAAAEENSPPARRDVVVWLSLDGLSSRYFERAKTPTFDHLRASGVSTLALEPVFPSITFPSHVSLATGVKVEEHGVPSNVFYDAKSDRTYAYPWYGTLLEAEPIWLTAARQERRVAVHDWPLSHGQRGRTTAVYFEPKFDITRTDEERLDKLLSVWSEDQGKAAAPLQLLMGYVVGTDKIGHQRGPDSHEVIAATEELDALLGSFVERATKIFDAQRVGKSQLYIVLTTDHGMAAVHTLVHLGRLADVEALDDVTQAATGSVGDLFFASDMPQREAAIDAALAKIREHKFARAWRRDEIPEAWGLRHPTRVGDILIALDLGYTFSRQPKEITAPVNPQRGPLGMHGYDPAQYDEMCGPAIFWRYPDALPARKLDRIDALQLHPTVCQLLGIKASSKAKAEPIVLEAPAAAE